jgi:imidazolonepropionase-like amidohydrolase
MMKITKKSLLLSISLLYAALLTSCITVQSSDPITQVSLTPNRLVINHATVFTGNPNDQTLVRHIQIDNGVITQLSNTPIIDESAHTINAEGLFLMPGLIDFHTHISAAGAPPWKLTMGSTERNLSSFLAAGITSLVDPGSPLKEMQKWDARQQESDYRYPHLVYAGTLFTAEHGHPNFVISKSAPWPLSSAIKHMLISTPNTKEEATALIAEHKEKGASLIKVVIDEIPIGSPQLSSELLTHIAKEANKQGLLPVAHIGTETEMEKGLDAGINVFVHNPYRSTLSERILRKASEAHAIVIPTNIVFENLARFYLRTLNFTPFEQSFADPDIIKAYSNPPAQLDIEPSIEAWFKEVVAHRQDKIDHVKRMMDADITILAGSDSPNVATLPGSSLHKELELWVNKGHVSTQQALSAATYTPGKLLHRINQRKTGYIEEGFEADILLINGNPLTHISDTQKIEHVILKGSLIEVN